jgi:murein DD-endopeptidase MepM/ murein hydrolase activator NlpD
VKLRAWARPVAAIVVGAIWASVPVPPEGPRESPPAPPQAAATPPVYFQFPLPNWERHCLGFGSEWRYCNGTPLRTCPVTGAVWLHTAVDIRTGIQPVMAAADGVIAGYIIDSTFRGGVLIRHQTSQGVVLTQYWHVWLRPGYKVGSKVSRGEVFADIADMGSLTHFHFAVFIGDFEPDAWRGALPPTPCSGFPAFPYRFVDPTAFIQAHEAPPPFVRGRHCRLSAAEQASL